MAEYIEREAAITKIREEGVYGSGYSNQEREDNVVDMIESIPAADVRPVKWIPVTERLPELHEEVLVCTEEYGETVLGFAMVAVFDGTGWLEAWERKTYLTAVTHWMPLPEPPKEDEHG